ERVHHAAARAVAIVRRGSDVEGVAGHAKTDQLGIDARAAFARVLVFLQHDHPGAVAEHKAVAILVPWPAGALRIVVARRQRARLAEAGHAGRAGARLAAA